MALPTAAYLAVHASWIALTIRVTFNLSVWLLWFGICCLPFSEAELPAVRFVSKGSLR